MRKRQRKKNAKKRFGIFWRAAMYPMRIVQGCDFSRMMAEEIVSVQPLSGEPWLALHTYLEKNGDLIFIYPDITKDQKSILAENQKSEF